MISVVSPLYRTAEHLEELIDRVERALRGLGVAELILVDDASPDLPSAWQHSSGKGLNVRLIRLDRNVGQHAAIHAGLGMARGDVLVVLDSDLQDAPEDIPLLVGAIDDDTDVAIATRVGGYQSRGREWTGRMFRLARFILTRGAVPDNAGLFLAARRSVIRRVMALDDPSLHLVSGLSRVGAAFRGVPLRRHHRRRGDSSYSSGQRISLAMSALVSVTPLYPVVARARRSNGRPVAVEQFPVSLQDMGDDIE